MGFHELVVSVEHLEPLLEFGLDALHRPNDFVARRHVVARRIHDKARHTLTHLPRKRIKEHHRINLVVEKLYAYGHLGVFRREDVNRVAANAESTAQKFHVVAFVLHLHELTDEILALLGVARTQNQTHLRVALGFADAVNGRDRCHDHSVTAFENRLGGGQSHLLDVLVDGRVLFDEEIARRYVGFGLIVVVVRNEVFDGVVREELAHFAVKLRGERLVGRHHDGGHPQARNDVGHGKGLARPRHAQKRLCAVPLAQSFGQLGDGRGLIPRGIELRMQLKRRMLKSQNLSHENTSLRMH